MNNKIESQKGETKNITLRAVIAWILGILFLVAGIPLLLSDLFMGVGFILAALLTLPASNNFLREKAGFKLSAGLRSVIVIIILLLAAGLTGKKEEDKMAQSQIPESKVIETAVATSSEKDEVKAPAPKTIVSTPTPVTPTPVATAPAPKEDRATILAILKSNASAKWKDDYEMVKYEYEKQVEAYDWVVAQTQYPNIMTKAKQKWKYEYDMVKYEYQKQAEAYEGL